MELADLTAGATLKEEEKDLSRGNWRGNWGGILRDNLGEGSCESKLPRDSGELIFAAAH